jgi:hypothetical protein
VLEQDLAELHVVVGIFEHSANDAAGKLSPLYGPDEAFKQRPVRAGARHCRK